MLVNILFRFKSILQVKKRAMNSFFTDLNSFLVSHVWFPLLYKVLLCHDILLPIFLSKKSPNNHIKIVGVYYRHKAHELLWALKKFYLSSLRIMVRNMCMLIQRAGFWYMFKDGKKNQTTNKHCIHVCLEVVQKEAGLQFSFFFFLLFLFFFLSNIYPFL